MENTLYSCVNRIVESDQVVGDVVKTHIDSICRRVGYLFTVEPHLEVGDKRVDIHIKLTPKPGVLFCNSELYPKVLSGEITPSKTFRFKTLIGIEIEKFKRLYKNPDLLLKNLEAGKYGLPFRTEINGWVIKNHIVLNTSGLVTVKDKYFFTGNVDNSDGELVTYDSIYRKYRREGQAAAALLYGEPVHAAEHTVQIGTHERTRILSHHVYKLHTGKEVPKGMVLDHINGDILDNRIENLRVLKRGENISIALKESKKTADRRYSERTKEKMSKTLSDLVRGKIINNQLAGKQKITYDQVKHYRKLYESGKITKKEIIKELDVNESTVSRFLTYATFNYG